MIMLTKDIIINFMATPNTKPSTIYKNKIYTLF